MAEDADKHSLLSKAEPVLEMAEVWRRGQPHSGTQRL